ncbi:hypothetical protein N7466_003366 [Penicillium verhagenii]|uniref:uncharacterized protein n=1 Tax=Penicillium verhagenii TaxID=1562060 RepID=UPI002544DF45|nr:uncharacterized protein N7466_003366 [Penicillium verhagenii]KAJ5936916.1 hypothetical protein N7466_003366 [Penicillium verhagenii]
MAQNDSQFQEKTERRREQNKLAQRRFRQRYSQRKATGPQDFLDFSLSSELQGPELSRTGDNHHQHNTNLQSPSATVAPAFDFYERTCPPGIGTGSEASTGDLPDYINITSPDDCFLSDHETLCAPNLLQQILAPTTTDPPTQHAFTPFIHHEIPMMSPQKSNNGNSSSSSSETGVAVGYQGIDLVSPDLNLDGVPPRVLSPLHQAVRRGHQRIVQILLAHQANCNEQDGKGRTPLVHAVLGGHKEVANLLLSHGAQIGIVDDQHRSALHWAVLNRRDRLLKRLLRYCAGESTIINGLTREGKSPLFLATETGFEAAVEMLLDAGADVHCKGPGQGMI